MQSNYESYFERFTDQARKAMALANQEAQRFNHEYIGTEHVLLGIVKEGGGVAANVLKNFGVDLRAIRVEVEKMVRSGPDMVTMGKLPQTPRTKNAMEYAIEEARNLGHNYIGTEHLLLGLMRERDGVAALALVNLGLSLEDVREEVIELLGGGVETEAEIKPEENVQINYHPIPNSFQTHEGSLADYLASLMNKKLPKEELPEATKRLYGCKYMLKPDAWVVMQKNPCRAVATVRGPSAGLLYVFRRMDMNQRGNYEVSAAYYNDEDTLTLLPCSISADDELFYAKDDDGIIAQYVALCDRVNPGWDK